MEELSYWDAWSAFLAAATGPSARAAANGNDITL